MAELAKAGDFCPNPACSDHEEIGGEIIRHGRARAGVQRYNCLICGRTFTATRGAIFYRRRTAEAEILECLALLAEGSRISRVKGRKEDTIAEWLLEAAGHAELVENALLSEFRISRGQLDGLWSACEECRAEKKGHAESEAGGQFFRSTMMDMDAPPAGGAGFRQI